MSQSNKYFVFVWIPSHSGIKENDKVDSLAKSSLSDQEYENYNSNMFDLRKYVRKVIKDSWENDWKMIMTDNKLRSLKPDLSPWKNLELTTRHESKVLTRLRIGHTSLTHSFLMDGSLQPRCECGPPLTIRHLFDSCERTVTLREKYSLTYNSLSSNNIKIMKNIIKFLTDLGICKRI
jgi:hypothetical protein